MREKGGGVVGVMTPLIERIFAMFKVLYLQGGCMERGDLVDCVYRENIL